MILRLLPFLQKEPGAFREEWLAKWKLLDEAFQLHIGSLAVPGKPVFAALEKFVEMTFPFSPEETSYIDRGPEVDGNGDTGESAS